MKGKTIEILDEYNPDKKYKIHIRKQISLVLSKLEKGNQYQLSELIDKWDGVVTKKKNLASTRDVFKQVMRVGKDIGIIKEVTHEPISFENFCKLDTVSYMRKQLKQTKFRNEQAKTKHSGGGTRRSYTLLLWHFNSWLHGKTISIPKMIPVGDNLQKIETVQITLDSIEDLLKAYQETNTKGVEIIRLIKEYLMDSNQHSHKSKGYMSNIISSIKAYFEKNESPIVLYVNLSIDHDDIDEIISGNVSTLSLEDLMQLLTTGKPSIVEKAVVLCKFHGGLDNSTFSDRFNFEAFPQLVKYFGSDKHDSWDLEKCPVLINVTRIKVGFPHVCCLERDAITTLQKALDWRAKKTGSSMKIGQAMLLNTKLNPVTNRLISDLVPKLAERCGIQKKFQIKSGNKNEKTSHELRDLLKSTLNSMGVKAYASNHLIGHMPRDSYEKEAILYPDKIRAEYMKASSILNIFTKFTSVVNGTDDSDELRISLKDKLDELEKIKQRSLDDEAEKIRNDKMAEQNARQMSQMMDMINELKTQINSTKNNKSDELEFCCIKCSTIHKNQKCPVCDSKLKRIYESTM